MLFFFFYFIFSVHVKRKKNVSVFKIECFNQFQSVLSGFVFLEGGCLLYFILVFIKKKLKMVVKGTMI